MSTTPTPAPDLGPLPEPVRAEFERWAKDFGRIFLDRLASGYKNQWTQECWVAWQGAWTVAHAQGYAAGVAAGVPATVAWQALEALESVFDGDGKGAEFWTVTGGTYEAVECKQAIRALRAALASPALPAPTPPAEPTEHVSEAAFGNITPTVTGSPDEIWLCYGDLEYDDTHATCYMHGEVTWCQDKQGESDVRYVRAALASPTPPAEPAEPVALINRWRYVWTATGGYFERHADGPWAMVSMLERAAPPQAAQPPQPVQAAGYMRGDIVRKRSGAAWEGRVCGEYSTALTPQGYAVESSSHAGSVQIYPAAALELVTRNEPAPAKDAP